MSEVLPFHNQRAYFSDKTPERLHQQLDEALNSDDPEKTERILLSARSRWPNEADVHVALYKFYFVSARYNKAEAAVWQALKCAAKIMGVNRNYRRLSIISADWKRKSGAERFYLFSLKALGVCRLRRARVLAARTVLRKLAELDEANEIGGGAFLQIAESFFEP